MDTATIYFLIAAVGCVVGVGGWIRAMRKEAGISAATIQKLETQINYLLEEVTGLKAELKVIQEDIKAISATTLDAKAKANAAHDRLDAYGLTSAHQSREQIKNNNQE